MESDSDDDNCQLFNKAVENLNRKRQDLQTKLKEIETEFDYERHEDIESVIKRGNSTQRPKDVECKTEHLDVLSESDDNLNLAELSKRLKSRKSKSNRTRSKNCSRPSRSKRKRVSDTSSSKITDLVITFDDDTGYPINSLAPIKFKSANTETIMDLSSSNISLNSDISFISDEDVTLESNGLVILTVEWYNGVSRSRKQFKLRKFQKLQTVFEELARIEGLPTNRILLMHNFNTVSPSDTPSSLNFKYYGALTGSVVESEICHSNYNNYFENEIGLKPCPANEESIKVKLQFESQKTLVFTAKKHEKVDVLYQKCAEELECPTDSIKIVFDGDFVDSNNTLLNIGVEDDDLFHVYLKH